MGRDKDKTASSSTIPASPSTVEATPSDDAPTYHDVPYTYTNGGKEINFGRNYQGLPILSSMDQYPRWRHKVKNWFLSQHATSWSIIEGTLVSKKPRDGKNWTNEEYKALSIEDKNILNMESWLTNALLNSLDTEFYDRMYMYDSPKEI